MIHEDRFVLSRRQFAIRLDSFRERHRYDEPDYQAAWYVVDAVWYRREKGVLRACTGTLSHLQRDPGPETAEAFLALCTDSRYGGDCIARLDDSKRYWGSQLFVTIEEHIALLTPMIENYPQAPDGYSGWWRFA